MIIISIIFIIIIIGITTLLTHCIYSCLTRPVPAQLGTIIIYYYTSSIEVNEARNNRRLLLLDWSQTRHTTPWHMCMRLVGTTFSTCTTPYSKIVFYSKEFNSRGGRWLAYSYKIDALTAALPWLVRLMLKAIWFKYNLLCLVWDSI